MIFMIHFSSVLSVNSVGHHVYGFLKILTSRLHVLMVSFLVHVCTDFLTDEAIH